MIIIKNTPKKLMKKYGIPPHSIQAQLGDTQLRVPLHTGGLAHGVDT